MYGHKITLAVDIRWQLDAQRAELDGGMVGGWKEVYSLGPNCRVSKNAVRRHHSTSTMDA